MKPDTIYKLVSLVGILVGGIGTLISNWADEKKQQVFIGEKVMEAINDRYSRK